ncbi:hypothetical protein C0674_10690 [Sporolactobacillus terrae]|uniref:Uncharacterized protein n=1 Tax=Sporolactobacillus terrae TaxID=269673 RepID=A0ABX5Q8U2_9BACL|nr:hypothetical protein C0674_10690 [Sporolactobacillus terrae]QAA26029.1 hypothetical protein C0679_10670 [Sporolactobacillus terrae]
MELHSPKLMGVQFFLQNKKAHDFASSSKQSVLAEKQSRSTLAPAAASEQLVCRSSISLMNESRI